MPDEFAAAEKRSSLQTFAERLIACDAGGREPGERNVPDAFSVCEKLRPQLATLMGSTGFHALLSRALAIARKDDAWLCCVVVTAEGSLSLREGHADANPQEMAAGSVVLVATLVGLLVTFIGGTLTLRLVHEVWPALSQDDSELSNGDTP